MLVDEALSLFVGHQYSQNRSEYTVVAYQTDLNQFFKFAALELGQEPETLTVDQVDIYIVRSFLGTLSEHGLARKSMARKLAALRSFSSSYAIRKYFEIIRYSGWRVRN